MRKKRSNGVKQRGVIAALKSKSKEKKDQAAASTEKEKQPEVPSGTTKAEKPKDEQPIAAEGKGGTKAGTPRKGKGRKKGKKQGDSSENASLLTAQTQKRVTKKPEIFDPSPPTPTPRVSTSKGKRKSKKKKAKMKQETDEDTETEDDTDTNSSKPKRKISSPESRCIETDKSVDQTKRQRDFHMVNPLPWILTGKHPRLHL